jgi:hypothetical protein
MINRKAAIIAISEKYKIDSTADWPYRWRDKVSFAVTAVPMFIADVSASSIADGREQANCNIDGEGPTFLRKNKQFMQLKTAFGLVGLSSLIACLMGHSFSKHYKEVHLYPFLVRRFSDER